jgi:hypothetical protein
MMSTPERLADEPRLDFRRSEKVILMLRDQCFDVCSSLSMPNRHTGKNATFHGNGEKVPGVDMKAGIDEGLIPDARSKIQISSNCAPAWCTIIPSIC